MELVGLEPGDLLGAIQSRRKLLESAWLSHSGAPASIAPTPSPTFRGSFVTRTTPPIRPATPIVPPPARPTVDYLVIAKRNVRWDELTTEDLAAIERAHEGRWGASATLDSERARSEPCLRVSIATHDERGGELSLGSGASFFWETGAELEE
jgi:hypothetical protein